MGPLPSTTTLGQSGLESYVSEGVTSHSPEVELTTRYSFSLVSYPEYPFMGVLAAKDAFRIF